MEEWRTVQGYKGKYLVSSLGRIKSLRRKIVCKNGHTYWKEGRIMRPHVNLRNGYSYIGLYKNASVKRIRVHRIVAIAFHEKPSKKHDQVNHKNGVKTDNRAVNLEWTTAKENTHHAVVTGLKKNAVGSQYSHSKLKESDIPVIRSRIVKGDLLKDISSDYGVGLSTIMDIKAERTWRHVK